MQTKYDEMEKDLKFAQMLMKTYVDQIAREQKKIDALKNGEDYEFSGDETLNSHREKQHTKLQHKKTLSNTARRLQTLSNNSLNTMVTIRNNEGKACTTKQVTK